MAHCVPVTGWREGTANNIYRSENKPFWDGSGEHPTTSRELLRAFLDDLCDDIGPSLYTEVEIKGFCLPSNLALLRTGGHIEVDKPVALLDDRNNQGTDIRGKCRPSKGALSSHQLYLELNKPRFVTMPGISLGPRPASPIGGSGDSGEPDVDAERRLIYITDLDRCSILAIIATASSRQAGYYKDFIYRHLVHEAFIGVRIPILPKTYAFEFHLPFSVCRLHPRPIRDRRRRADQEPLRGSWDLNFLDLDAAVESTPALQECFYEAQVSFILIGFETAWAALLCADTYYRRLEDNRESVEYYAEENKNGDFKMDPLSRGIVDANRPIWDAEEYFLRILGCRMEQARKEEHNCASRILYRLRRYTHEYRPCVDDQSRDQRISQLAKTIEAWDSFEKDIGNRFFASETLKPSPEGAGALLPTIKTHVSELRSLRQKLVDRKESIESIEQQISQHLQRESNKIAHQQQLSGNHMRLLAIMALIFNPITVSSGLFSVDGAALPFQKTWQSYILVTICLGVFMLAISTIMLNWEWHYSVRDWALSGSGVYYGGWFRVFKRGRPGQGRPFSLTRRIFVDDRDSDEFGMEMEDDIRSRRR
ncbi:hypothetical protein V8F20_010543 [Naviculisporaceae sp. PSN 640]